jgi:protein-tyrosine-phosphatase
MVNSVRAVKILVVCSANECRSAFAVDQLRAVGFDQGFAYISAGTQANPGAPRCPESHLLEESAAVHSSRVLDVSTIKEADLIVVMDRDHRARVAELDPSARFRCFTLKELARLSVLLNSAIKRGEVAVSAEFESLLPANWKSLALLRRVQWWVKEINEARGFSDPENDDIADAHGNNSESHRDVLEDISQASKMFGENSLGALKHETVLDLVGGAI